MRNRTNVSDKTLKRGIYRWQSLREKVIDYENVLVKKVEKFAFFERNLLTIFGKNLIFLWWGFP